VTRLTCQSQTLDELANIFNPVHAKMFVGSPFESGNYESRFLVKFSREQSCLVQKHSSNGNVRMLKMPKKS